MARDSVHSCRVGFVVFHYVPDDRCRATHHGRIGAENRTGGVASLEMSVYKIGGLRSAVEEGRRLNEVIRIVITQTVNASVCENVICPGKQGLGARDWGLVFGESFSLAPSPQPLVPTMFFKQNVPIHLQFE